MIDLSPACTRPLARRGVALATAAFGLVSRLAEPNLIGKDYYISVIGVAHLNATSLSGSDVDLSVYFAPLVSRRLTSVI